MKKNFKLIILMLPLAGIFMWGGCKSDFNTLLPTGGFNDSTPPAKTRKVLYLIVDGARGWAVRDAKTPAITSLLPNSTYTWYSLADPLANDGNGWANLMTGVTKLKHQVVNDAFTGAQLQDYPTVVQRVKATLPTYRVATFAASAIFKDKLTAGADVSQAFSSDAEVKSAIVSELNNDNAGVVIGQFDAVNQAGIQSDYNLNAVPYKNAIIQFDQYLSEMLIALKARKNYPKEDWLVVITSNRGGNTVIPQAEDDKTVFSDPKLNTFTILYNPGYKQTLIARPFAGNKYIGSFVKLYSNPGNNSPTPLGPATIVPSVRAEIVNNSSIYNFQDTTSFTIELKVKKNQNSILPATPFRYNWPVILSKKSLATNNARNGSGWAIALEVDTWRFLLLDKNNVQADKNGNNLLDANWHSLAVVLDSKNMMQTYQDGDPVGAPKALPANFVRGFESAAPLVMGYFQSDNQHQFNGYISDVRIFRAALPDAVIKQYACDTRITSNHPYWGKLVGYWPCTDGSGLVIKDESPVKNDFQIRVATGTTLEWTNFNDIICPPSTTNLAQLVPQTYDLPRQIYSWLAMPIPETWLLDGKVWFNQ